MGLRSIFLISLFLFLTLLVNHKANAMAFQITPKVGTSLPTSIPTNGTAYAYYTVQNMSVFARQNNTVKNLPKNVTQVTDGGFYSDTCTMPFDLEAHGSSGDSCTLQLLVSGAVHGFPKPFVCLASSNTACFGTQSPLNVSEFTIQDYIWENTLLTGSEYISDLAVTNNNLYAGGLVEPISGQIWQFLLPGWLEQYATPTYASKVSGMIPTADNSALYITSGNIGFGVVDLFTPGQTAPSDITGTFTPANQTLNDLSLGESNVLYAAGAIFDVVDYGEVWSWNGDPLNSEWTSTQLSSFGLAPAFWLSFVNATPTPFSPSGLYVASYLTSDASDNPVVYRFSGLPTPVWSNTLLPSENIDTLISLNVDSNGTLYAAGSKSSSGSIRGAIVRYNGSTSLWEPLATPPDAQSINIMEFATVDSVNYYFLGGSDLNSKGAVWVGNGEWWINTSDNGTGLTESVDITTLRFYNGILFAGGFDNGQEGAVWSLNALQ